jgi:ADP-glucose pyrophosphorylase
MKKKIKEWEKRTNEIVEDWLVEVFDLEEEEKLYIIIDWVSDSVGGVFNFADYWISFDSVLEYYKHNITPEQFKNWYDWSLENQKVNISLARFILSPAEKEEQEKKQIEELRERVESARKELQKAIEKYESN